MAIVYYTNWTISKCMKQDDLSNTEISILYVVFPIYPKNRVQNIFPKTLASSNMLVESRLAVLCTDRSNPH